MYLRHLSLTHFRNYKQLELDLTSPLTLIQGENAQGKTNLLEAVFMLATSKPIHATSEREIVDWAAGEEPIPYSRIAAQVGEGDWKLETGDQGLETNASPIDQPTSTTPHAPHITHLEIILSPKGDSINYKKQVKINGAARRAIDLVGLMRAVLFLPEDVKLVDGSPGERRRYLDIALCQIDRAYTRALSEFQKVLEQRNGLLKSLRERAVAPNAPGVDAQLSFWDEKLIEHGSIVIAKRHNFVLHLNRIAIAGHSALSSERERLSIHYLPSFNPGHMSDFDFAQLDNEKASEYDDPPQTEISVEQVTTTFRTKLNSRRRHEIDAGNTLYGPQRDDLRFVANRRDLRLYGSRGQQRTAALALKLAEVRAMTNLTGAAPILLLDDVMSELDARRRATLLSALDGIGQAILTTTDWEDFNTEFRNRAQKVWVKNGEVVDLM